MRRVAFVLLVAGTTLGCRPKGSDKKPTIQTTSVGNYVIKHPNFEGYLNRKVTRDGAKFGLSLDYSGFPEKSSITLDGKTFPLARSGEVPTSLDLSAKLGDAPIATLTGGQRLAAAIPFELSFWGGRQKVSSTITDLLVSLDVRRCLESPPCTFANEGPPNAKPNIAFFQKKDAIGQTIVGSPARVRDIDWVAISAVAPEVEGKVCKMQRLNTVAAGLTDDHTLQRESERIVVYDRRSGAKLHERVLIGPDRCPAFADIQLGGPKSGLRSEVQQADRDLFFKELRGESPAAAPSSTAQSPSRKPKNSGKK